MGDEVVRWSTIEAECDGFRSGFVAVFHKYEGMPTDKSDAHGRPVKVTRRSFAEHVGVSESAFGRWVKKNPSGRPASAAKGPARSGQVGRQIAKSPTVSTDDKVGMLTDLLSDKKVLRQYREQRAPNVSESDAKAAQAIAKAITDPIAKATLPLTVPMWLDWLRTMTDTLAEHEFPETEVRQMRRALNKLDNEITVQEFRLGLVEA